MRDGKLHCRRNSPITARRIATENSGVQRSERQKNKLTKKNIRREHKPCLTRKVSNLCLPMEGGGFETSFL
jgi:hypothetical protein